MGNPKPEGRKPKEARKNKRAALGAAQRSSMRRRLIRIMRRQAFQTWLGSVGTAAIALRVSTMHSVQSASSW